MTDELDVGSRTVGGFPTDAQRLDQLELRLARLEARAGGLNGSRPQGDGLPRTVLTVLGLTGMVLLGGGLVFLAWGALSLVLIAVFFAFALNPAVEVFVRRGWPRGLAATAVFLLALLAAAVIMLLAGPPLVKQVKSFADGLPALSRGHGPLGFLERKYQVVEHIRHAFTSGDSAKKVAVGVATTAVSAIVISFLTFFMLLEGPRWVERLLDIVPGRTRQHCENVGYGIYQAVGGFVTGNLVASLLGGAIATIVLLATGIPYAIPLGLLVALLDLIPIVGAILAPIVLGLVSLTQGVVPAIVVVSAFFVYHQIEVYYLRPLIYGRTVELSPLAVLVAVVVGAELAGLLGTLVAIPVAAGIQVLIGEVGEARSAARKREILEPVDPPSPG
jgi:predicted PurR-regulated permease PerM